jgi:hypothetical protein
MCDATQVDLEQQRIADERGGAGPFQTSHVCGSQTSSDHHDRSSRVPPPSNTGHTGIADGNCKLSAAGGDNPPLPIRRSLVSGEDGMPTEALLESQYIVGAMAKAVAIGRASRYTD